MKYAVSHAHTRILHIWNTAGIGGYLARYMDSLFPSLESHCIMRVKYDSFELMAKGKVYTCNWFKWFLMCLIIPYKYHIIHVHGYDRILPFLKILYPRKKILLHYHGTEIRGNWATKKRFLYRLADKIIVSTPDLLKGAPQRVEYLPNPIHYDRIDELKAPVKIDKAFHVDRYATHIAMEYARELGKEMVVLDRENHWLTHKRFLTELTKYAYYIDVKRPNPARTRESKIAEALSLTALEASYAGVIVINWRGELIKDFPEHHKKEEVCQALYRIYQEVLNG